MIPSRILGVLASAIVHFHRDRASQHAAAVSYYALVALAPLLYILGWALRAVVPDSGGPQTLVSAVEAFLPGETAPVLRQLVASLPRGDALAVLAVPALLYVASNAFSALDLAVNVAFATTPRMRFWLSRLKAFAGVSALGLLLLATLIVGHTTEWIMRQQKNLSMPVVLGPLAAWFSYGALLASTFVAFTLLYKVLPRAKVRWPVAARAAVLATVLWELARQVFAGLLERSPSYGMLTGVLAASVAFLLWVYTAVLITLLGAEVAALLNGNRETLHFRPSRNSFLDAPPRGD